jgi:hypothetical protein
MDKIKLLSQLYIIYKWVVPIICLITCLYSIDKGDYFIDFIQSLFIGGLSIYFTLKLELENGK